MNHTLDEDDELEAAFQATRDIFKREIDGLLTVAVGEMARSIVAAMTPAEMLRALELAVLIDLKARDEEGPEMYWHSMPIAEATGLPFYTLKTVLRGLKERGEVEFGRGLLNDDGEFAGSGHRITEKGRAALARGNDAEA